MERFFWPIELINKVKELAFEGLTASEISLILNKTRCSVLGVAYRNGIKIGNASIRKKDIKKLKPVYENDRYYEEDNFYTECQFPMWDNEIRPGNKNYGILCGKAIYKDYQYCKKHCIICFTNFGKNHLERV